MIRVQPAATLTLVKRPGTYESGCRAEQVVASEHKLVPLQSVGAHNPSRGNIFDRSREPQTDRAAVDLYWLPLGAGGHCVRTNGRVFEVLSSAAHGRGPCDLYHSALEVHVGSLRYVIEMAPVWNERTKARGVVAEGAVGDRRAGRLRLFRYEVRRWRDSWIPDMDEAVDSPRRLSSAPTCAARILDLVPQVPTSVWGRDELQAGDMWNSNSLISWLLVRSGLETDSIHRPIGGRAPGWQAGLVVARRQIELETACQREQAHA